MNVIAQMSLHGILNICIFVGVKVAEGKTALYFSLQERKIYIVPLF